MFKLLKNLFSSAANSQFSPEEIKKFKTLGNRAEEFLQAKEFLKTQKQEINDELLFKYTQLGFSPLDLAQVWAESQRGRMEYPIEHFVDVSLAGVSLNDYINAVGMFGLDDLSKAQFNEALDESKLYLREKFIAHIYENRDEREKAIEHFKKSLTLHQDPHTYLALTFCREGFEDFVYTENDFLQLSPHFKPYPHNYFRLTRSYLYDITRRVDLKTDFKLDRESSSLLKVLKNEFLYIKEYLQSTYLSFLHSEFAMLLFLENNYEECIAMIEKKVTFHSDEDYYVLYLAYTKIGDNRSAQKWLQKAKEKTDDFEELEDIYTYEPR